MEAKSLQTFRITNSKCRGHYPLRMTNMKRTIIVSVIAFLTIAVLAASAVQGQIAKKKKTMTAEYVSVGPYGFEPKEIKRPQGPFLPIIRSKDVELPRLRLDHESNQRLHEMAVKRANPFGELVLDLSPGRYRLTEADHPNWIFWLTILAK
jgi:hypothetical protein